MWCFRTNNYDNKVYYGNSEWLKIPHNYEVEVNTEIKYRTTCKYCNINFNSRNALFKHLGFCNVDIRPDEMWCWNYKVKKFNKIKIKKGIRKYNRKKNNKYLQQKFKEFLSDMNIDVKCNNNNTIENLLKNMKL